MSRLACVSALAGCVVSGSTIHAPHAGAAATPAQCAAPGALKGAQATKYQSNCLLCALVGVQGISSTYHLPNAKPEAAAKALAQHTAPPNLRKAVHDGCIHGFHLATDKGKTKAPAKPAPPAKAPPAPPPPKQGK